MLVQNSGPLVIIGGAEDKLDEQLILKEFIRLAGGDDARIVIMTTATAHPHEVGEAYTRIFRQLLGGGRDDQVQYVHLETREETHDEKCLRAIETATGVFFTGGDQSRITSLLGGTKIDALLHARHEEHGLVLAGTSAGASMMSTTMIVEGPSHDSVKLGAVRLGAGLEFLPGVLIDQHFAQRGRINRLLSAIAEYPHHLGIGIDEDTALIVHAHEFEVIGSGTVTVVDAAEATDSNLLQLKKEENLALCNVKLHILTAGYGFSLRDRLPRPSTRT